jgi:foldase protein PrsA
VAKPIETRTSDLGPQLHKEQTPTMKRTAALILIATLALALAGCGGKETGMPKTVATVDGKPISGTQYCEYLSMGFGRQVLPMIIDQQVLLNWAEKEKVPVTDEQIDKQIEIVKRDGNYEDRVRTSGGEEAFKAGLREQQARSNLGEKMFKFTDDELMTMYNQLKPRFVHGARKQVAVLLSTSSKKVDEAAKAIKDGMDFDEAVAKYADQEFSMSGSPKAFVEAGGKLPALWTAAEPLKEGQVSKPFTMDLPPYGALSAILKVVGNQPKLDLGFKKVKDEVKSLAALQKTVTDPDFQKKLEAQRKKADIKIELPQYKYMVSQIKNPPPPMQYPMSAPNVRPGPGQKPK